MSASLSYGQLSLWERKAKFRNSFGKRSTGWLICFLVIRLGFGPCSSQIVPIALAESDLREERVSDRLGLCSTSVARGCQELWGKGGCSDMVPIRGK